jgi:hypothetical protein
VFKQAWKERLDAELKERLGLTVTQGAPFARPALTLSDGSYVPPLNRESRRMLDKHLSFRYGEPTASGAVLTRNFRWTRIDEAIYELASSRNGAGWSTEAFLEFLPERRSRLKMYQARAETLKRIGYLTSAGRVTEAFTLHYRVHSGSDHPELQRLRADLYKKARAERKTPPSGSGEGGPTPAAEQDENVDLWLGLHRHQALIKRLQRLGVSPEDFRRIEQQAQRHRPSPEVLAELRANIRKQIATSPPPPAALPRTKGIIRAYCGLHRGRLTSFFVLSKGLLRLSPGEYSVIAEKIRERARLDYFYAKEKRLAQAARRLRPLFWIGRILMPDDVHRLELALQRCHHLASAQQAAEFLREYRARAYRNSRSALIEQLRSEAQSKALDRDPALARKHDRLREQASQAASVAKHQPVNDEAIEQLCAGMEVLRLHRPRDFERLGAWRGRGAELVSAMVETIEEPAARLDADVRKVAVLAGRAGYLLAKERRTPPSKVPPTLRAYAKEVSLANARFGAAGAPLPFSAAVLSSAPPAALARALVTLRHAGFLDEGPQWTLRADAARAVSDLVRKPLERIVEQDLER